jgi:prepilin-type N-terminal cleavage/methylation domain-containing protein
MIIRINNQQSTIDNRQSERGFSLTEVLIAIGLLAVGMLFIAGSFPVSIHLTTVATERTIAATVADEAFAKCSIYSNNPDLNALSYNWHKVLVGLPTNEFSYPSTPTTEPYLKKYWWSAIIRRISLTDVQVTVFVSRKVGAASQYLTDIDANYPQYYDANKPEAVAVAVSGTTGEYELTITDNNRKNYINDGYTIVDDATGQIYRVLERYPYPNPSNDKIKLDRPWRPDLPLLLFVSDRVWVVSPPQTGGGRYPCIGVYQKIMRF